MCARFAVSVRLALLLGLFTQLSQAAAPHAAGLTLLGLRNQDTADRVCRSFKICHNSKGTAWTTVQLFSALEPLLHQLKLEPATEYVEVQPLTGCLTSGCCCSTPVEVRFSLPVHRDRQTAADELAAVSEFLQFRLSREMKDTACTAAVLGDCPPALAAERKLLSPEKEDDTLPPLPAGLIPYDGKKPALEMEDYTPAPAAKQQQQQPKPQQRDAAKPAAAKPADDPSQDPKLPEGLIPYDHKTTRQLLEEMDAAIEEAAVAAVPEMPAISISALGGAAILEAGTLSSSSSATTPGTYGSGGRALLELDDAAAEETVGGYGGRSLLGSSSSGQGEGMGTYGGRSLLGEGVAAAATKDDDQSKADNKKAQKPAEEKKQQQKPADNPKPQSAPKKDDPKKPSSPAQERKSPSSPPQKKQQAPTDSSSSSAAPCSAAATAGNATAPNGRPFGTCYCRYNPKDSTWALEQAACRAALFQRCKTAGSLLECSQVEAFYRGLAMPGSEAPHRDSLSAFLYADCPPAPPCSCKALLSGPSETATARARCCTDLQAHCQVPFSGLDCEDVGRFCRPYGRQSSDPLGALFSYVLVKTHGFDCSSPRYAVSYASVVAGAAAGGANGGRSSESDEAMRQLSKAAMVEGISRFDAAQQRQRLSGDDELYSEQDRVAVLATMLVGGCIAMFVAAAGVALIFKMVSTRNHHTTPLLSDRL